MSKKEHLNHFILHDGSCYRVFEKMGKKVPYEAYNPNRHLGIGDSPEEAIRNSSVPSWDIDIKPVEVIFNE